jgi:hypothetical protein
MLGHARFRVIAQGCIGIYANVIVAGMLLKG